MERIKIGRAASWAGGVVIGDAEALVGPDVVIDSRAVTPGALFVALPGERVDGHDYVERARAAGAGAALVTRRLDVDLPQIVVPDAVAGLSALARGIVTEAKADGLVVVGVTGSSGKTSTKDLLAQVLEGAGPTVAPPGSFNNEIGAPLTAARVDGGTKFLVAEMGSRGIGHVAWLCSITPPSIAVVLNVGSAHLGEFGTVDAIAQAKGEIVEALDASGWAVLNADAPRVAAMASRTPGRIVAFSASGDPGWGDLRVWASDVAADSLERYGFVLHVAGVVQGDARVQLAVLGRHQVSNALAAASVALASALPLGQVADGLSAATSRSPWRMELGERADGLAVLNDAYNANPDSMAAAFASLHGLRRPGGRLIAALGDMLELGPDARGVHRTIGGLAAEAGVDELLAVGEFGPDLVAGFAPCGRAARSFGDVDALTQYLHAAVGPRDVVLVKASRGLALDRVASALLADEGALP